MSKTLLAALAVAFALTIGPASARQLHQTHPSGSVRMHMAHGHVHGAHKPG